METLKIFIKTEEGEEEEKDNKTQFLLEETPRLESSISEGFVHIYLNLIKKENKFRMLFVILVHC
jgi:hypothetical protein